MFPKKHRVHTADFPYILKKPIRFETEHFRVLYLPNSQLQCSVVVSKKITKKAHNRNLEKRKIVHLFKKNVLLSAPYFIIIFTKKTVSQTPLTKLEEELKAIIKKLTP
jgi:ribonuclease P protein component